MNILKKLAQSFVNPDPNSGEWTDETGVAYPNLASALPNGSYAFLIHANPDQNVDMDEFKRVLFAGTSAAWIRFMAKGDLSAFNAELFTGAVLYVVDILPDYLINFYDNATLAPIPLTYTDITGTYEFTNDWEFRENNFLPVQKWSVIEQKIYDAEMVEATSYIDRWEDLVEIGHATQEQKAFWGEWKQYRANLRNWHAGIAGFEKRPLKPIAISPALPTT